MSGDDEQIVRRALRAESTSEAEAEAIARVRTRLRAEVGSTVDPAPLRRTRGPTNGAPRRERPAGAAASTSRSDRPPRRRRLVTIAATLALALAAGSAVAVTTVLLREHRAHAPAAPSGSATGPELVFFFSAGGSSCQVATTPLGSSALKMIGTWQCADVMGFADHRYVLTLSGQQVQVVDTLNRSTRTIAFAGTPQSVAVSADSSEAAVLVQSAGATDTQGPAVGSLQLVDLATGAQSPPVQLSTEVYGPRPLGWPSDGIHVAEVNCDGLVPSSPQGPNSTSIEPSCDFVLDPTSGAVTSTPNLDGYGVEAAQGGAEEIAYPDPLLNGSGDSILAGPAGEALAPVYTVPSRSSRVPLLMRVGTDGSLLIGTEDAEPAITGTNTSIVVLRGGEIIPITVPGLAGDPISAIDTSALPGGGYVLAVPGAGEVDLVTEVAGDGRTTALPSIAEAQGPSDTPAGPWTFVGAAW